ncbi:MAG: butyrate kinase, partial [Synergistaceae bacterium]|nr:butyrate kinase [Synergistaceae bacterium]
MAFSVLAVNPGSTSTKVAQFSGETAVWSETIRHSSGELAPFGSIVEQFDFRLKTILGIIEKYQDDDTKKID